jgi:magnesium-transporting ATPase (P-type)
LFGVVTFFVLAIYWAIDVATIMGTTAWSDSYIRGIVDALIIGITLLVVGIPEGLPLAVIISLAYSMKAMTKDNNLVRHLQVTRLCFVFLSFANYTRLARRWEERRTFVQTRQER